MRKVLVYPASKLEHADQLNVIFSANNEIMCCSGRWIKFHTNPDGGPRWPGNSAFGAEFWTHDIEDVLSSDLVLVYNPTNAKLKGGLVEVGAAIGAGLRVITVGQFDDLSTWQYHPLVRRVDTIHEAIALIRLIGEHLPNE